VEEEESQNYADANALSILAVDDSRLVRAVITQTLQERGYDTVEAGDGVEALDVLKKRHVDLVLLDLAMPVLDGPSMLERLRGEGDETPVILLTGKTETAVIANCIRSGISDYILKPVKQEELIDKVRKVIGGGVAVADDDGEFDDPQDKPAVLLVDDSEMVADNLREILPEGTWLESTTSADGAVALCTDMQFSKIVIDTEIPGQNSVELASKLGEMQNSAQIYGLYLRNVTDPLARSLEDGFSGFLVKPFETNQVNTLFEIEAHVGDLVVVEEGVVKILPSLDGSDDAEVYFSKVGELLGAAVEQIASDSYPEVILDVSEVPRTEVFPLFVESSLMLINEFGLGASVVGPETVLVGVDTGDVDVPVFQTVDQARVA